MITSGATNHDVSHAQHLRTYDPLNWRAYCQCYEDSVKLCMCRIVSLWSGPGAPAGCGSLARGVVRPAEVAAANWLGRWPRCCCGKQWHCENRRAYACFSRDATRHLCAISQTDHIVCARAAPVTISHFEISARLQRTLFRCAAAGRSIYAFCTSDYVKLAARMEAMTSPRIPPFLYNVDSSTDEVVLCLFFVCRLQLDAIFCVK